MFVSSLYAITVDFESHSQHVVEEPNWSFNSRAFTKKKATFGCSLFSQGVATAGSAAYLIWQIFTLDLFF